MLVELHMAPSARSRCRFTFCSPFVNPSAASRAERTKVPLYGYFPFPLMQLQNKEQMDKPAVQQLQVVVIALKQKIQEFNAKQLVLRSSAKSMDTNRAWTLPKH